MSVIGSRTFGTGTAKFLTLQNEELVRQFGFLNGYNHLRVGFLFALNGNSNFNTINDAMGCCQAGSPITSTLGFKSNNQTLWAGQEWGGAGFGSTGVTFVSGPPAYWSVDSGICCVFWNGSQHGASAGTIQFYCAAAGSGCRSYAFVDVHTQSNGGYIIAYYLPKTIADAQTDFNETDIILGCEEVATSALHIRGNRVFPGQSVGFGTGNLPPGGGKLFDCLSNFWPFSTPYKEIYGMWAYGTFTQF